MTTTLRTGAPVDPPIVETRLFVVVGNNLTMMDEIESGGTSHDFAVGCVKD